MSAVFRRGPATIEANLTPLIDVTFLLIVFFVLVSQIVEVENVPMSLPEPTDPVSQRPGEEQRAVINVIPVANGEIGGYRLGGGVFPAEAAGLEAMTGRLAGLLRANPRLSVNLRADRSTRYEHVEPVLQAISTAAARAGDTPITARVNLVVVNAGGGS